MRGFVQLLCPSSMYGRMCLCVYYVATLDDYTDDRDEFKSISSTSVMAATSELSALADGVTTRCSARARSIESSITWRRTSPGRRKP